MGTVIILSIVWFFDLFSRLLYSTQPQDFTRIKDLTKSGKTITEALRQVLLEKGGADA